jgi:hypothetical protein
MACFTTNFSKNRPKLLLGFDHVSLPVGVAPSDLRGSGLFICNIQIAILAREERGHTAFRFL